MNKQTRVLGMLALVSYSTDTPCAQSGVQLMLHIGQFLKVILDFMFINKILL